MSASPAITPELIAQHGLTPEEYTRIQGILGRDPNFTELGIFSVMWSEHCSYKNTRKQLRKFPTTGDRVLVKAGEENAGVIDIGDGWAVAFKMESHNHPSAIEPFQGAATGVGGIIRDIFTMGARPVFSLNSLRFGPLHGDDAQAKTNRRLFAGVVAGIAHYGNCIGVPTIGGEVYFDDSYNGNPLVNVFCLGVLKHEQIARGAAKGVGNPVFYVGAETGRDGLAGAAFASRDLTEESKQDRPAVQVGDPFREKLLLEACLELLATDAVAGIQEDNDRGLWSHDLSAGVTLPALLEGQSYTVGGTPRTLTSFKTLGAPAPGQSQKHSVVHNSCLALAKFADKATALVLATHASPPTTLAVSGAAVTGVTGATYKSFGVPTNLGGGAVALAKLSDKTVRVGAFFPGFDFALLDSRSPVPGHPLANIKSMKDPVARDTGNFAVLVKLTGTDASAALITSANDDAIIGQFHTAPPPALAGPGVNSLPMATLVAREGQAAPGAGGATFGKFKGLLVPNGPNAGCIIYAQLLVDGVNVTSANDYGIWSYIPGLGLQKIVREGDVIDLGDGNENVGKIVGFKSVSGSPDHQRSGLTQAPEVLLILQNTPVAADPDGAPKRTRIVSLEK